MISVLKLSQDILSEIVRECSSLCNTKATQADMHCTIVTLKYIGFHRKSMQIKQKTRRTCMKIGFSNEYHLIMGEWPSG